MRLNKQKLNNNITQESIYTYCTIFYFLPPAASSSIFSLALDLYPEPRLHVPRRLQASLPAVRRHLNRQSNDDVDTFQKSKQKSDITSRSHVPAPPHTHRRAAAPLRISSFLLPMSIALSSDWRSNEVSAIAASVVSVPLGR